MNEITIDMSSPVSDSLPSSCNALEPLSNFTEVSSIPQEQSTADSALTLSGYCIPVSVSPVTSHACYLEDVLNHLKSMEEVACRFSSRNVDTSTVKSGIAIGAAISPSLRAKMVDWMIEVLYKSECATRTLFRSVSVMDRFLSAACSTVRSNDLHMIGVVAMLLASKFEDVTGMDVQFVYEQVVHKKFTTKEIADYEMKVFEGIQYSVSSIPTELEFFEAFAQTLLGEEKVPVVCLRSAILNLYSSDISCIKPSIRAAAALLTHIKQSCSDTMTDLQDKLCTISGYSQEQITAISVTLQKHEEKFKQLYPKLKNASVYCM